MTLLDQLLAKLAPHECLGCGAESALLCSECADRLVQVSARCYRCHVLVPEAVTCAACRQRSRLHSLQAVCLYQDTAKALVWKLKLAGAQAATGQMAERMLPHLPRPTADTVIVPVPTATSRIRRRGYDQAELLARELARQSHVRQAVCLTRITQSQQHGAHREQRLRQLAEAFRVTNPHLVPGRHIILVDDVVTTGATLEAAASMLHAAGARQIDAIVFAQA